MKNIVDLHIHSNTKGSDGEFSPKELIRYITNYIKDLEIKPYNTIFSLTDHNSVDGLRESDKLAKEQGIRFIPGCEVMVFDEKYGNFEILGYSSIDKLTNEQVDNILQNIRNGLESRINQQINLWYKKGIKINDKNIKLSDEEYQKLIKNPEKFNDWNVFGNIFIEKLIQVLEKEPTIPEINKRFYDHFREPDGELYIPYSNKEFPKPEELISSFNKLEIESIFAHLGEYHINEKQRNKLVNDLIDMKINGLEIYIRKNNDLQIEKYLSLAKKKNLVITGGCDFHKDTPQYRLGTYRVDPIKFIPFEIGEKLYERVN